MKIISIGSDRELFNPESASARRVLDYWANFEEVNIIIFDRQRSRPVKLNPSERVSIYSTRSISRWLYVIDAFRIGRRLIRRYAEAQPEVLVSCQDPFESGLVGLLLNWYFGVRWQVQLHTDLGSPHYARLSLLNRGRVYLAKFLLPRADLVRVVSRRLKDSLVSDFGILAEKITIQPVEVDIEALRQAPLTVDLHRQYPQFDQMILMASRLTPEKNISLALQALALVIKQKPKVGLVIVGSGPDLGKLKRETAALGLTDQVIFIPWTNDLGSYYKTADLFLNTSWYEGYGRTMVEAQAVACPVVSTDVGIARELAVTIADFSVASVAQAILGELS